MSDIALLSGRSAALSKKISNTKSDLLQNLEYGVFYLRADQLVYSDVAGDTRINDTESVANWSSLLRGHVVTQATQATKPIYGETAWTGSSQQLDFSGVQHLTNSTSDDFNVSNFSFMAFAVVNLDTVSSFRCVYGTGESATATGFRCFIRSSADLALFYAGDVSGNYTVSTTKVVANTDYVLGWGIDASTNQVIYVINDTIERKAVTVQTIPNTGIMKVGGSNGSTVYNLDGSLKSVYLYNPKNTSAISNDTITTIKNELKVIGNIA